MKNLSNLLLLAGLVIIAYAIFSKFYGQPSVACKGLMTSKSLLILGNTSLLLSLIASVKDLCKK
ncbi:MAG: hypothetical protein FJZ11_01690 [Candidatus Omnitrophica bacterium]|nr:hypothetical protein [Candidatus Omnitrophota bacterium]